MTDRSKKAKEILENVIRGTQANFDHLQAEARRYSQLFNQLADDVAYLYSALGIEPLEGDASEEGPPDIPAVPRDHHDLEGLDDDDHPQYTTDAEVINIARHQRIPPPIVEKGDPGFFAPPSRSRGSFDQDQGYLWIFRLESSAAMLGGSISGVDGDAATTIDITGDNKWVVPSLVAHANDNSSELMDPNGWVNPNAIVSPYWGFTIPANYSVMLPPGRYIWRFYATYTKTAAPFRPSDSALLDVFVDFADDAPAEGSDLEENYYSAYQDINQPIPAGFSTAQSSLLASMSKTGVLAVSNVSQGVPYTWYFDGQRLAESCHIRYFELYILKVE